MCSENTALPFEIKGVKLSNSDNTIIRNNDCNLTDNESDSQNHNELNKMVSQPQKFRKRNQNESLEERERRLMKRCEKSKEMKESASTESREKRLSKRRERLWLP